MRNAFLAAAAALAVAGCSEEAPAPEAKAEKAALTPGEYEISWTVASLGSTDKTTPATELAQGATGTARACVADGGEVDPALFALGDNVCTAENSYVRAGRISMQLDCRSESQPGQIMQSVTASSTADSLEGEVTTSTYLSGTGDYEMRRTFTGRRVGECPPAGAGGADGNAAAANTAG